MIKVAYHDLCWFNWREVLEDLERLESLLGGVKPALMVVPHPAPELLSHPNFEASSPDTSAASSQSSGSDQEEFAQVLTGLSEAGHVIYQHGLAHYIAPSAQESFASQQLNTKLSNEAEFAGMSQAQSKQYLQRAQEVWSDLGLPHPQGFVPPTWHAPRHLRAQAHEAGFSNYESRTAIHQFSPKKTSFSIPMSFWGASLTEFQGSLRWNMRLFQFARLLGVPLRLALHPSDFSPERRFYTEEFIQQIGKKATWSGY